MIDFVSLHNHTSFSIGRSISDPFKLLKRAKELGQKSIGICDYDTMAGMWDLLKASKKVGIPFIPGCYVNFVNDVNDLSDTRLYNIVLLAKTYKGYQNLLELRRIGFENYLVDKSKSSSRIDWNSFNNVEGIVCLSGAGTGYISQLIMQDKFDEALKAAERFRSIFGSNFYLELVSNNYQQKANRMIGMIDQRKINLAKKKIADQLGISAVVTTNSHYIYKEEHDDNDVLMSISAKQPIFSGQRPRFDKPELFVQSAEQVYEYFNRHKNMWGEEFIHSLFANSVRIADECEFPDWVDPKFSNPSGKELPDFPVKDQKDYQDFLKWIETSPYKSGIEDKDYLRYVVEVAFQKKIDSGKISDIQLYRDRIEEELDVLNYCGVNSYMLIVADYVQWARDNNISVGTGRGCLDGNTHVLTDLGYKLLKDIKVGDFVFTHKGRLRKVLETFEYDVDETGLEIKSQNSFGNLVLTSDHEVFASKGEISERYLRLNNSRAKLRKWEDYKSPNWLKASQLSVGDCLFVPNLEQNAVPELDQIDLLHVCPSTIHHYDEDYVYVFNHTTSKNSVSNISKNTKLSKYKVSKLKYEQAYGVEEVSLISDYLTSNNSSFEDFISNERYNKIPRFIKTDKEFWYLVGRWVGDGWLRKTQHGLYEFGLAFHSEDESITKLFDYLKSLGFSPKIYISQDKKLKQIRFYTKLLYSLFKKLHPEYKNSNSKYFGEYYQKLPLPELNELIAGYFDSDGCDSNNRIQFDTTSVELALQTREVLLKLGKISSISVRKPFKRQDYLCKKSYKIRVNKNKNKNCFNGFLSKIIDIKPIHLSKVYDIHVEEDMSYLTSSGAVHNSVGGSYVAHLLNIHVADSIKYDLVFARFHNKLKQSYSDIDLDFATSGRDRVIDYICAKYGSSHVTGIANWNTLTTKPYVKAIAKTFNYGNSHKAAIKIGDNISEIIEEDDELEDADKKDVTEALDTIPLLSEYAKKYPELRRYAEKLNKKIQAVSTHAAGIIIGKRQIGDIVPIRRDADGNFTTEYEKDRSEDNGLVKMDILGLSTLDIITTTYRLIKERGKEIKEFELEEYDQATYDLISSGNTLGVFQFGKSLGTIAICKKFFPKTIEDLALITTLARPAAKEIRDDFFEVKNGKKQVELIHPLLERAFRKTYGFALYDESLLILAEDVAGWSLHEADRLRKLTKEKGKNPEKAAKWRQDFIDDALNRKGVSNEDAEKIWELVVEPFQKYSFNKSHAVLYSMISYHTAWLKAHYPLEFLVANLYQKIKSNAPSAKEEVLKLKAEIRMLGVSIVPPNINEAQNTFKIVDDKTLLVGLDSLTGIGKMAIPEIVAKRPFKDLQDFFLRCDPSLVKAPAIQALAAAGALDCFGIGRKKIFFYGADMRKKMLTLIKRLDKKKVKDVNKYLEEFNYEFPTEPEWTIAEKYALEKKYVGEGLSGSVVERFPGFFNNAANLAILKKRVPFSPCDDEKERRILNTHDLPSMGFAGIKAIVTEVFSFKVKKETSKIFGQEMCRISILDPYNNRSSIVAFPDAWAKAQEFFKKSNVKLEPGIAIFCSGKFQMESEDSCSIILDDIVAVRAEPQPPEDKKGKKIKMKTIRVSKEDVDTLNKEELLEELEDEMIFSGLNDDWDETTWEET